MSEKQLLLTLLLAFVPVILATSQFCTEVPNTEAKSYTYIICNGTSATNLQSSREFCQKTYPSSDIVTFASKEEFDFISKAINDTITEKREDFRYIPGFSQEKNSTSRFNPETGIYFWVTDPTVQITNESTTYWNVFHQLINNFTKQSLFLRQRASFALDADGKWYAGESLTSPISSTNIKGGVICMKKGVPEEPTPPVTSANTGQPAFQYWLVIAVAAGVVVLGLLLGGVALCLYKKKSRHTESQKFSKVPQSENNYNNNAPHNSDV